jgi:transcriptional regulator with XRE-family HTH domain
MTSPVLAPVVEQVRAVVQRRGLSEAEVARMAGVDPKTVRRLLTGQTCGRVTLEKVCAALGVPLDFTLLVSAEVARQVQRAVARLTRDSRNRPEVTRLAQSWQGPVSGWSQAARLLGVSRETLRVRRRAAGDMTSDPWWRGVESLYDWYDELRTGLTDPGTEEDADPGTAPDADPSVG